MTNPAPLARLREHRDVDGVLGSSDFLTPNTFTCMVILTSDQYCCTVSVKRGTTKIISVKKQEIVWQQTVVSVKKNKNKTGNCPLSKDNKVIRVLQKLWLFEWLKCCVQILALSRAVKNCQGKKQKYFITVDFTYLFCSLFL